MAVLPEPLTAPELRMLQAYAEGDAAALATLDPWAREPLVTRGYLQPHARGMLVTPEGLAALLDVVPADVMRTASPVEDLEAEIPGAPSDRSTAPRRSSGRRDTRSPRSS